MTTQILGYKMYWIAIRRLQTQLLPSDSECRQMKESNKFQAQFCSASRRRNRRDLTSCPATATTMKQAVFILKLLLLLTVAPTCFAEESPDAPDSATKPQVIEQAPTPTTEDDGTESETRGPSTEGIAGKGVVDASGKFSPREQDSAGELGELPSDPAILAKRASSLIRQEADGKISIGKVSVDPKTRTISIPAAVNARQGLIEYALVTNKGKIHEALFSTDASPLHIHLAALLLGLAPVADTPNRAMKIEVEVEWKPNGPARREPLTKLVALAKSSPTGPVGGTLEDGPWEYVGSSIDRGNLAAEREGSLIALIGDPVALIINPRPGRTDDELHVPNAELLPGKDFPVTVHIRLAKSK